MPQSKLTGSVERDRVTTGTVETAANGDPGVKGLDNVSVAILS